MIVVCLGWLAQTPHLHLILLSLQLLPHFRAMEIQEVRRGTETEHFVLAARPLFNFFSQKTNMNMERLYG